MRQRSLNRFPALALLCLAIGCAPGSPAGSAAAAPAAVRVLDSGAGRIEVSTVASGLEHPWGLAFLPDGRFLVTERTGKLRFIGPDGILSEPIKGLPELAVGGQGGLLDVVLDPDFAGNRTIYLSFSEPGEGGAGTSVLRARLGADSLGDVSVVFRQSPKLDGGAHFGSRLVFDKGGRLFVTTGDRQAQDNVQRLDRGQGKIHRIERDGGTPADNPFVAQAQAQPTIWSFGHRNAQGAALHPDTGELWQVEHGAKGGDELNIARASRNYGWPVITLGVNYNGQPIGAGLKEMPDMEQPLHQWTPSIAPSGLAFYTSDRFPAWRGNLFVGALAHRKLVRLELDGERVTGEENLLEDLGERIRDVRQGPDGYLYLLTDSAEGRLLRVGLASP